MSLPCDASGFTNYELRGLPRCREVERLLWVRGVRKQKPMDQR
jgi:hypothetical protein